MKAQNGLKFPSELCFGIMNATKDSYLLNSKVAFLKSGQNAAGNFPFFLRWIGVQSNNQTNKYIIFITITLRVYVVTKFLPSYPMESNP